MKILTIANRKGGVGKTTLCRTLAEYWSMQEKRVLAIDLDSQCSLSQLLLPMERPQLGAYGARPPLHPEYDPDDPHDADWSGRSSSADIFFKQEGTPIYTYPVSPYLDILPADKDKLAIAEDQDVPKIVKDMQFRLREFLELPEVTDEYDIVLVDTGPGENLLAHTGLRACTHVLVPVELEHQSVRGLYEILGEIRREDTYRTIETRIQLLPIQPNRCKLKRKLHQEILTTLQTKLPGRISPIILPDLTAFAERDAHINTRSLFRLAPSHKARKSATEFCYYIDALIFKAPADDS